MSEMIDTAAAVRLLQGMEDVAILCHKSPDGDTLGCGFALLYALQKLGKRAVVLCKDPLPDRYAYLGEGTHTEPPFVPKAVVAVDTASDALLGEPLQLYADRVDLCIDHHPSNTGYAKRLLLRPTAAAACELMTDLLTELSGLDERMADCLYTGLVTDTGCFKHPSVTVDTHRIAQRLLLAGAQMQKIHRMYDSMTKGKAALTAYALEHLRYELDGRCALVVLPRDVINLHQVTDDQLEGISSLQNIAFCFAASTIIVAISTAIANFFASLFPAEGATFILNQLLGNKYLIMTTITMICATAFPKVFNDAPGANEIGTFLIYIFFAVIGAPASIMSIITQAPLLLVYALIIVACNMLITLIFGKIFKFSLEEIILASNANIGGPTTAAAMAISKGWNKLVGPVLLIGTLGYVLGNYYGVLVGNLLR